MGFPGGTSDKEPTCQCRRHKRHRSGTSLGGEDPLEEGMATHSNILAWRIPWTEEPGGLQFIGSQRVGHSWSDLAGTHNRKIIGWERTGETTRPCPGNQSSLTSMQKSSCSLWKSSWKLLMVDRSYSFLDGVLSGRAENFLFSRRYRHGLGSKRWRQDLLESANGVGGGVCLWQAFFQIGRKEA